MGPDTATNPKDIDNHICQPSRGTKKKKVLVTASDTQSQHYLQYVLAFHKTVKSRASTQTCEIRENRRQMKTNKKLSPQKRKQLQNRIMQVLKAEMQTLSTEMQQILCDDLVTAFQNRLIVLAKAKPKRC